MPLRGGAQPARDNTFLGSYMFTASYITVAFISMFVAIRPYSFLEKRGWIELVKITISIGLIASVYCLVAGLYLLMGWQDPLAPLSSEEISRAAVTHGGKGGIFLLAIRFWPYVLIGSGGYFSFVYLVILNRWFRKHA